MKKGFNNEILKSNILFDNTYFFKPFHFDSVYLYKQTFN